MNNPTGNEITHPDITKMSKPTDIERAMAFLEKGVKVGDFVLFGFCEGNFIWNGSVLNNYIAIAILKEWLKEQLRDGGKNKVYLCDHQFTSESICEVYITKLDKWIMVAGHSDLDALIKAYDALMELTQESDGE